jgi:hypothetical protein
MPSSIAKKLVDAAVKKDVLGLVRKDVSWLWRTAYNSAVQGCADWGEDFEVQATLLFSVARDVRYFFSMPISPL